MMVTTLLFDVGGVIFTQLDAEAAAARSHELAQELGLKDGMELFARLYAGPEWRATRVGDMSWQELVHQVLSPYGLTTAIQQKRFLDALFEFEGVHPEMFSLINSLAQRYPMAILSNASDMLESRLQAAGLISFFDPVINSYRIGAAKPDAKAYQITLERLNVPAEQLFFIDDRPSNIDAAAALGIQGYVFSDVAGLKAELSRLLIV